MAFNSSSKCFETVNHQVPVCGFVLRASSILTKRDLPIRDVLQSAVYRSQWLSLHDTLHEHEQDRVSERVTDSAQSFSLERVKAPQQCYLPHEYCRWTCSAFNIATVCNMTIGTFLIGGRGGGSGYLRNFLRKSCGHPTPRPQIGFNAWPFTNA